MQCRLALGLALGLFRLGCDRNRPSLVLHAFGLDSTDASLRSPRSTMSSHRSGETFGRDIRARCSGGTSPRRLARRPVYHRLHRVAVSCFTPLACTSPMMSTARAYFVAVSCFTPSACTSRPRDRDRCKNARRVNDVARSIPVSTASFVSVAVSCFTPSACTSPMSTARSRFLFMISAVSTSPA